MTQAAISGPSALGGGTAIIAVSGSDSADGERGPAGGKFRAGITLERGFVFSPTVPDNQARGTALRQIVRTFFKGSPVSPASALLGMAQDLDAREFNELEAAIARERKARAPKS